MKKFFVFSILGFSVLLACGKFGTGDKLKKDTPAYELAKDLSAKLPYLDPEENNVLVVTNKFKITSGEAIRNIQERMGNNAVQLKMLDAEVLREEIARNVRSMAERELLLHEAQKGRFKAAQSEIDSVLNMQYYRAGSKEKFLELLRSNGISLEYVKEDNRRGLTINHYLDFVLAEEILVTEEDIREAYQGDRTATVRHIVLLTRGKSDSAEQEIRRKMEGILVRARGGEDFAELAKTYSEDPGSKDKGGLYESFGRGEMVRFFEEAAFSVPVGEISDIVETHFGYHIIKVLGREKETRPLEEVRKELEARVKKRKQEVAYLALVERLKEKAEFQMVAF